MSIDLNKAYGIPQHVRDAGFGIISSKEAFSTNRHVFTNDQQFRDAVNAHAPEAVTPEEKPNSSLPPGPASLGFYKQT